MELNCEAKRLKDEEAIRSLKSKIEDIFLQFGFRRESVGKAHYQYLVHNKCYCKVTYLDRLGALVIESADNIIDASNGALEDGDLYYMDSSEEDMLQQIRKDIAAYYLEQ